MLNESNLGVVDASRFSMVPRSDVPRSTFATQHTYKTTLQTGYLIPIHVDEVLPGDVHQGTVTIFARLNTLLFPLMDNMTLETFFFFVPNRLLWSNFRRQMGERDAPGASISYTTPQVVSAAGGFPILSVYDYLGLPTVGQVTGGETVSVNALPLRAYTFILNEWFRDQNLDAWSFHAVTDGPDAVGDYALRRRRKKHDYFTSALPFPLKGGADQTFPLSGQAHVRGLSIDDARTSTGGSPPASTQSGGVAASWPAYYAANVANTLYVQSVAPGIAQDPLVYADLTTAVGASLSAIRLAIATQQLLERDQRGGTRYTELVRSHFGVDPEDSRLQRPEFIGGGRSRIETQAIPQTSATGLTGGSTPLGGLGAAATVADRHSFSYHATEHGFIIGIVHVTADITYQQGLHRMWTRLTRYDYYWPAFANLGEQGIRNDELYCTGVDATDAAIFGYQERWAEYRHRPSRITGYFRSTSAGNIDEWHASQQFGALPTLNFTFIEDNPPISRVLAAGAAADNMQVLFDSVFNIRCTRALPVYSVPGLDRF